MREGSGEYHCPKTIGNLYTNNIWERAREKMKWGEAPLTKGNLY